MCEAQGSGLVSLELSVSSAPGRKHRAGPLLLPLGH